MTQENREYGPRPTNPVKDEAFAALRDAERKMYAYATSCDIGLEREQAFQIYENVRLAGRVG
jgi:hypothetical protein